MAEPENMIMHAIAVDDEPPALRVIEHFSGQLQGLVTLDGTFTKPNEALGFTQHNQVDLLFLDIQMPGITGIDFRKSVAPETLVIFTTAHSEYAVEGFNLQAIDYLLKPFTFDRYKQAVERASSFFQRQQATTANEPAYIFLRADYNLHKVNFADIVLVEGLDDYLKIHIQGQKSLVVRMTMKGILEKLPKADFVRVHRSYIVPMARILHFRNKMIHIAGREIPLGGTYERAFLDLLGE
jgi:DNA-binding LytR/AlgR family response regulator